MRAERLGHAGIVVEGRSRVVDVDPGLDPGFAVAEHLHRDRRVPAAAQALGKAGQVSGRARRRQAAPAVKGAGRPRGRQGAVLGAGAGQRGDLSARGRVGPADDLARAPARHPETRHVPGPAACQP
ncbi:MAG TPA: hypothetical protein PLL33_15065, partial [Paracoccus sp. (in: a-proteobacteria)]|nr:hypothetical protein [Paracoccus sp. (in: a-proteobacteria)]